MIIKVSPLMGHKNKGSFSVFLFLLRHKKRISKEMRAEPPVRGGKKTKQKNI